MEALAGALLPVLPKPHFSCFKFRPLCRYTEIVSSFWLCLGVRPPQGLPGAQPVAHPGLRPPMQGALPQSDRSMQFNQQNARETSMNNSHMDQLSNGEQNMSESKGEETAAGDNKVFFPLYSR